MAKDQQLMRLHVLVPPDFLRILDDWRRKQTDLPNRSEAIRRLVCASGKCGFRGIHVNKLPDIEKVGPETKEVARA
jgi:hypothetical protein